MKDTQDNETYIKYRETIGLLPWKIYQMVFKKFLKEHPFCRSSYSGISKCPIQSTSLWDSNNDEAIK